MPDDYNKRDPEHKMIYRFVRTLFNAAQLTAECAIVTLVSTILVSMLGFDTVIDSGIGNGMGTIR